MKRHFLICTTFREFDDGPNDKIQRAFLDSLVRQTCKNFTVIVTNFREKNVQKILESYPFDILYHQSESDFQLSFTEVVENSFPYIKKGKHILLWTNADNILADDYLEIILKNFVSGDSGTYFPLHLYDNLDDFAKDLPTYHPNKKGHNFRDDRYWKDDHMIGPFQIDPNYWLPDIVHVDADYFLDPLIKERFLQYRFDGSWPGYVQNMTLGFLPQEREKQKNLFYQTKVSEILNVYTNDENATDAEERKQAHEKRWDSHESRLSFDNALKFADDINMPPEKKMGASLYKVLQLKDYDIIGSDLQKHQYDIYCEYWIMKYQYHEQTKEVTKLKASTNPGVYEAHLLEEKRGVERLKTESNMWRNQYADLVKKAGELTEKQRVKSHKKI